MTNALGRLGLLISLVAVSLAADENVTRGRELSSAGCNACCYQHDCRVAYMQTSPGVCCGPHRATGLSQCCPMGATCVMCATSWRCDTTARPNKCTVCANDKPSECYIHSRQGGGMSMALVLLIGVAVLAACFFMAPQQPDVVYAHHPGVYAQPCGQPVYGQPQVVYGSGGGYGAGSVAAGAAGGFVGGMLVGEMLDSGHGGYGGGYGGGGYGGDYGGGGFDGGGGFEAD